MSKEREHGDVDGAVQEAPADEAASTDEVVALNEQRVALYSLLARLYRREVDAACLRELRALRYPVSTGNAVADEGYQRIARYLSNAHTACLDDLALDYARCFVGEGMDSFSAAYPYESVHTSEKRLLMQDARDEVLAIMRSEGVVKDEGFHETEDHIAAELEFMQVLAQRTVQALRAGEEERCAALLETQHNFIEDHLVSWTPLFTAELRKFARTDFYQGLACLTDGFLQEDAAFLREALA